jgi:hypothetical protein
MRINTLRDIWDLLQRTAPLECRLAAGSLTDEAAARELCRHHSVPSGGIL